MERSEIIIRLKPIVKRYLPSEKRDETFSEDADLLQDLGINSANLVDIIIDAEDEFDIEISDDEAEGMLSVGAAVDVIYQKLEDAGQ